MDATYKTTTYDLPLFFLAVKTNVDYQVVGAFITEDECTDSISEALMILKTECFVNNPPYFMTDFDECEISALEKVFPDSQVLICDFHRNQAWERWTSKKVNSVGDKDQILTLLRKVALAKDEDAFHEQVQALTASKVWQSNEKLQKYFNRVWYPHHKRWSKAFRYGCIDIVADTNNGLESQHKIFKTSFLHQRTNNSILSMLKILIQDFFPARYMLYVDLNLSCSGHFRKLSSAIPEELHKRPKQFVKHCLEAMEKAKDIEKGNVKQLPGGSYEVLVNGRIYEVQLGDQSHYPLCACSVWSSEHLPCVHMFSAMTIKDKVEWDLLSPLYMQSVFCTIDDSCMSLDNGKLVESREESIPVENLDANLFSDDKRPVEKHEGQETVQLLSGEKASDKVVSSHQRLAREALKKLTSMSYNISDIEVLKNIQQSVNKIIEEIQHSENTDFRYVPLKKRVSLKKYTKRSGIKAANLKKHSKLDISKDICRSTVAQSCAEMQLAEDTVTQEELLEDELLEDECHMDVETDICRSTVAQSCAEMQLAEDTVTQEELLEDELLEDECHMDVETALDTFWEDRACDDSPVLQIGPFVLTRNSFQYLKSTLSDEVIDAYMTLLLKNKNILYINCITATSIFQGRPEVVNFLTMENLHSYECCMAVVNEGGAHWVLLIILAKERKIIYVNPLGENIRVQQDYLQHWYYFLQKRYQSGIEICKPSTWTVSTEPHAKQQDSTSCGVYVLKFAENYVVKGSIGLEPLNVEKERRNIGRRLISSATTYTTENDHPSPIIPRSSRPTLTQNLTIESSPTFPRKSSRPPQRKRKRSSFVYSTPKKQRRSIHCICRKPNDGRKYWCCDGCNTWYHPACVGKTEDEEEKEFFCPYCTETDIDVEVIESDKDVSKAQAHKTNRINGKTALEKYPCALGQLQTIIACTDNECTENDHIRHHKFVKDFQEEIKVQKRKFGFGLNYFTASTIENITEQLTKDLLYRVPDKRNPVTSLKSAMVRHVVEQSDLWNLFIEYKMLAAQYILYVLAKEMLILIAAQLGQPYEKCEEQCMETEKDRRQLGF